MALSIAGRNERLTDAAADYTTMGLFTADPGVDGSNEVTGGSPAYARQSVAWATAAAGEIAFASATAAFNIPAGTTVTHLGFFKGSVFQCGFPLDASVPFTNRGTLTVENFTLRQPAS